VGEGGVGENLHETQIYIHLIFFKKKDTESVECGFPNWGWGTGVFTPPRGGRV